MLFRRTLNSAAQPQPNDRGEVNTFIASSALRHAALSEATPLPPVAMRQVKYRVCPSIRAADRQNTVSVPISRSPCALAVTPLKVES